MADLLCHIAVCDEAETLWWDSVVEESGSSCGGQKSGEREGCGGGEERREGKRAEGSGAQCIPKGRTPGRHSLNYVRAVSPAYLSLQKSQFHLSLRLNTFPSDVCTFYSLIDRHLGFFPAIVNRATVNVDV